MSAKPSSRPEKTKGVTPPVVSIVVPVYNEEGLLHAAIVDLIDGMSDFPHPFEVLICENGSTDDTIEIALALDRRFDEVRVLSVDEPNYGKALRAGIIEARGDYVICDEIDILDRRFYDRALDALMADQCDMVVGSKLHPDSMDRRPILRTSATKVMNLPVVERCVVDKDLFASELVIRAERLSHRILEVPVEIVEKRAPSVNLFRRVPNVFKNLARLFWVIRVKG